MDASNTMKLFKVEIPKSMLSQVPENERVFFVQLGNLLNDLSILQKLSYFSANTETADPIGRSAQNSQAVSLILVQAGKLWEGWQMLQKQFFGTKLSGTYENHLTDPGTHSLEKLKNYFNKENLIFLIRNKFAFHYDSAEIKNQINEVPDSEVLEVFMAETHGNCFYSISHILVLFGILKSTGCSNIDDAMRKLFQDMLQVTRWFVNFLGDCLLVFARRHLGFEHAEVEIPEPPHINNIALPYFVKGEPK
jgi:hypothetical protein